MSLSSSNSEQDQLPGMPTLSAWGARASRGEDVLGLAVQSTMNHAAERDREAVAHRGTLCRMDILSSAKALRVGVERNHALAVIRMIAVILNVPTEAAPFLPLRSIASFSVWLDSASGCVMIEFRKTVSPRAAKPLRLDNTLPGSLLLQIPLPTFLADTIRAAHSRQPLARVLGNLFPCEIPDGHLPIVEGDMGRLRTTPARLRRSLPIFAVDLGIDRYYAALVTCGFYLVPRARYYYTLSDATTLSEARRRYYDTVGWGSPVPQPPGRPFGSTVVLTDRTLRADFALYAELLRSARPPKRWQLEGVVRFHNAYVVAAAWLLIFCCGPRAMKRLRFRADSCVDGVTHLDIHDKRVGGHELHLSMTVCRLARQLITNFWGHLNELHRRALHADADPNAHWLVRLQQALNHEPVPLFFLVKGDVAVDFGTRRVLAALPKSIRPVANWSRQYWQTTLLAEGVCSSDISVWARHMLVGDEQNSSTSIAVRAQVQRLLGGVQDTVLDRLGFTSFRGLASRSIR